MGPVDRLYDLRDASVAMLVLDAFRTMLARGPRMVRVIGMSPYEREVTVDVSFDEVPLRRAMLAYAVRILALSLLLSAIVASLLLLSLRRMIIVPLATVTERLLAFRERPEDAALDWEVSGRQDEIGIVERELAGMQRRLRQALLQKTRLAALGEAVGRVSHELKNILASAMLISDRLEGSADPAVRTVAPRLVATLERAVRLCAQSLNFAREQPAPPRLTRFGLAALIEEVRAELPATAGELEWDNRVPPELEVTADRDQLYRVLVNLWRNSREALAGAPGRVTSEATPIDGWVRLRFGDTGPGIDRKVLPRLFETFSGSTKPDGSGLGLAICREIMRAHGGEIRLARTGPEGTEFELDLPDRPGIPALGEERPDVPPARAAALAAALLASAALVGAKRDMPPAAPPAVEAAATLSHRGRRRRASSRSGP
jgi:signal transduction histidine kinase